VIRAFLGRPRGVAVATLVVFAWAYGFFILNILPQWHALEIAQGGLDLQERFVTPQEVGDTLTGFNAQFRQDALIFYLLDVPNFLLLAAAGAAVTGFGLRNMGVDRFPYAWTIALPLAAGAADAIENATLGWALLTNPAAPLLNAASAIAIWLKLSLLFITLPVVTFMGLAGLTAWVWKRVGGSIAARN
jgi:hypothetical protein